MKISQCLDIFIGTCTLKGLSYRSIDNYEKFVGRFIEKSGDMDIKDFNYKICQDYISDLYIGKLSRSTIGTYIRHLKVFIRFLEDEQFIQEQFSKKIKIPKQSKKILRIYSDDEIKVIFESIDIKAKWIRYRNSSIFALMLDSGIRLEEICNIDYQDIDFKQNLLKVHGKGDKERLVPLGAFTRQYIKRYLQLKEIDHGALFISRTGERISRNSVKLLAQKMKNNLPFEFSCHKLRHNFATNYCIDQYNKNGFVDIYKLMILLGHEDIKTTRRYLHLANQIICSKQNISHLDKVYSKNT